MVWQIYGETVTTRLTHLITKRPLTDNAQYLNLLVIVCGDLPVTGKCFIQLSAAKYGCGWEVEHGYQVTGSRYLKAGVAGIQLINIKYTG